MLPEPTAIPRTPPTATCSRRSALLWCFFKGQVCHALLFTVQGGQIRIDDHVFVVGDQTALEETLGKTIVEAIKREASRR